MTTRTAHGSRTLAGRYYTDPAIWQLERTRLFEQNWLCVGRSHDLTDAGACRVVAVNDESLLLVRDSHGQLRGYYNVCRHRGTRVCEQGDCRSPVKAIQCSYHGWTWSLDGNLLSAPNMPDVAEFDPSAYPLHAVAIEEWLGFVFVSLGQPEPLATAHPEFTNRLAAWSLDELVVGDRLDYDVAANWKLLFQNYNECYHCPRVHPALNKLSPYRTASNDFDSGAVLGGPMGLNEGVDSMTPTGRAVAPPLPRLPPETRRQVCYYTLFPTMFISPHPDFVLVHRLESVAVDTTKVTCEFLFHPDALAAELDPGPAVRFWDETNRQDWHVCELSQQGVSSRAYKPGPYADLECTLAAFDRHYLESLGRVE